MRILYNLFGLINCFEQITCNTFPGYKNTVNENFAGVSLPFSFYEQSLNWKWWNVWTVCLFIF